MAHGHNLVRVLAASALMLAPVPAFAHHVMGGELPATFMQGLLSGLGHPVIGLDHFAAIVGVGLLAALATRGLGAVMAFTAAMIGGVVLHAAKTDLPVSELLVGLTTVILGLLVARRLVANARSLVPLFGVAGLVHGYALGESIVGAEPSPLGAYLLGLFMIQSLIAAIAWNLTVFLSRFESRRRVALSLTGVAMIAAGAIAAASAAGLLG